MSFLSLPAIDTSLGLFDVVESPQKTAAPNASNPEPRGRALPRITTYFTPREELVSRDLSVSASAAVMEVADALGISPSELPESMFSRTRPPVHHYTHRTKPVYLPPADVSWKPIPDYPIRERFAEALVATLGLDSRSIPRDESFLGLGGNQQLAMALRANCQHAGLSIETRDILDCKTLAELETHVTPLNPLTAGKDSLPPMIVSPLQLSSPLSTFNTSWSKPTPLSKPPIPFLKPKSSKRYHNKVEQVLSLNSDVSKASVLKPKAGLFEDQTIAFITLSNCVIEGPSTNCDIKLLNAYYTSQLPAIRKAVEAKVLPNAVPKVWIVLERMPLDQSGQISRRQLQTWIQNANDELYHQILAVDSQDSLAAPSTECEHRLHKVVCKVMNKEPSAVGMNQSFTKLGGDSTAAMQVVVRCKSQGLSLKTQDVLRSLSLKQLASLATSSKVVARTSIDDAADEFHLSPMQRLYFHTPMGKRSGPRDQNSSYRFNQSILLRFKKSVCVEDVRAAIEAVVGHHAMLRTRFRPSNGSWSQSILSDIPSSYHFEHHTVDKNSEVEKVITEAQASVDIENGPVFAAHHFHTNDGHQLLYLIAHHLAVDMKSWRVIAGDLGELLNEGNLVSGRALSFQEWTVHQQQWVNSIESPAPIPFHVTGADWSYWGIHERSNIYDAATANIYGNTTAAGFSLGPEITSLLNASNRVLRTESSDIFMAALLLSFRQTFRDRQAPTIWNQEHERDALGRELDISETVGWFTSLCPLAVDVQPSDDMFKALCHVKDARRSVAGNGVSYFAANLSDAESANSFTSLQCPLEVIFTYVGSMQSFERRESIFEQLPMPGRSLVSQTSDIGPKVGRIAIFEVSAAIDQGDAKFKFLYHRASRHQDLIQAWIRNFESILRDGINRLRHQPPELSMSDMPLIDTTYEGLVKLNREILPSINVEVSNIESIYPVTTNQQNILINESLIPGSSNSHTVYELNTIGKYVDINCICAAWQQVSERHPALRTVFFESTSKLGLFDQIILRCHSPNMLFIESQRSDDAFVQLEKMAPMTFTKGSPAHRLTVCQAPGKALIKMEASQAVCDAESLSILMIELEQAYFYLDIYRDIPYTPEISYSEYLQCLKTTRCSIGFWQELLAKAKTCHFPSLTSKQRDDKRWEDCSVELNIPQESLEAFAWKYKIEVSMVLQVAWSLVLRAYVGTNAVCFGYRTSGRDMPVDGLYHSVGCFSSVLICNLVVHPNQSLAQLLIDADEMHREALHHQHVSVSSIQHALETKGGRLFNTCLSFGYEHIDDSSPNAKFKHVKSTQASEYDINVDVNFKDGNVALIIGYRILTTQQAANIAHAFGRAIETVIDIPGGLVKDVDLFNEYDHRQILGWNSQPKTTVPKEHVHQLVSRRARECPTIPAVCAWDGNFTYAELDEMAASLSRYLISCGVRPQTPVPVIVEKSRWAVVAMLAVLNMGAILVPVDSEATNMFSWVISNVGAKTILASESIREGLLGIKAQIIFLQETVSCMLPLQETSPTKIESHETACILFNSAAAKKNKGIAYSHGALAAACVGQGPSLCINASSRVMQVSSFSDDIALSEIFTTLINGGCVCVPQGTERVSGFTQAAQRMQVNWTYMTPALSRRLQPGDLPDLAVVCFRTRQLDPDTYGPWSQKAKVLLAYGSAEACPLGLSAYEVRDSSSVRCIGSPFCGNFWVVNREDSNRLMPVGAVGELVIGSPTLANGYRLKDHVASNSNSASAGTDWTPDKSNRLLKTGNLVRYREDGQIELVASKSAKADIATQVEPRLRRCLGRGVDVVLETIAFKYMDSDSKPILAAFVELGDILFHGKQDLAHLSSVTKERLFLAKKMAEISLGDVVPKHMIPSTFIPVKAMPLTPSLKVNRHELQNMISGFSKTQLLALSEVPNPQEVQAAGLKPLPLTTVEGRVRTIVAEVLCIKEASITANDGFISLGGDSDLAHDLVIACRHQGISISVIEVLQNRTLSELCLGARVSEDPVPSSAIAQPRSKFVQPSPSPTKSSVEEAMISQVAIDRAAVEDVCEASSLQTVFIESGMLKSKGNINYFMINVSGSLDWGKLERACFLLTTAHPILRTAFASYDRKLFQTVLRSYHPDFRRYQSPNWRLNTLASKIIKRDQAEPIDFRQPVTRFCFLDGGRNSILVMRLSRAQYNDVSLPVLIRDLCQLYDSGDLVDRRTGFCEVVRAAQGQSLNGSVDYWRTLLEGSRMTQVVSQPIPVIASSDSKTIHQRIPTGSLHSLGIPFETILKGAWSVVLSNLSGSQDVVFGQLVDSKHLTLPGGKAASTVVGPTGNIFPVRTILPDVPITPYEYFRGVQSQHAASIPHENMQFFEVVSKCTDWPPWTRFSTVIQHKSLPKARERMDDLSFFVLGGASCKLSCTGTNTQESDLFVRSITDGVTLVDISLTFCEKRIQHVFAEDVLKMLCSTITLLTSAFVREPLTLKGLNDNMSVSHIPMQPFSVEVPQSFGTSVAPSPAVSVSPDDASAIHTIISTAWDTILSAQSLRVPDVRSAPFYEIWGSLIPAAELAQFFTEEVAKLHMSGMEGVIFTTEEVLDNPTMMQQYEMIIARQYQQQSAPMRRNSTLFVQRAGSTWSKSIKRLSSVGTPTPSQRMPVAPFTPSDTHTRTAALTQTPRAAIVAAFGGHKHTVSSGGSSMDSLTDGSSQSDEDELLDDVSPLTPATPAVRRPRTGTGMSSGAGAGFLGVPQPQVGNLEVPSSSFPSQILKKRASFARPSGIFGRMGLGNDSNTPVM